MKTEEARAAQNKQQLEKQLKKADGMIKRLNGLYMRLKKIEIRSVFKKMPELLNSYKREYGKLQIDIQHVKAPLELQASTLTVVKEKEKDENKIGRRILVMIRSAKNNVLLGAFNYTLPTRSVSRLKKEEKVVEARHNYLLSKRDRVLKELENYKKLPAAA